MIFPNGFKRLINSGYTFQNMHFNFMPTYTGPGHASIYTGTTPDTHGIVGNDGLAER
jgi:predicted AlkP superfamily pyrophosphatase or phosphodiesterase